MEAFEAFAGQVNPQGGRLFLKKGLQLKQTQVTGYYGVEVKADCYADGLRIEQGRYVFDYHGRGVDIEGLILGIPGRLNVENATAPSRWLWKPEYSLRKSAGHCLTLRE